MSERSTITARLAFNGILDRWALGRRSIPWYFEPVVTKSELTSDEILSQLSYISSLSIGNKMTRCKAVEVAKCVEVCHVILAQVLI